MNSERKAFCEYIKNEYNDENPIEWLDGKPIKGLHLMLWNAWQASANREGYKLVPAETLVVAIKWYDAAMEHTFDLKLVGESEVHKNSIEAMIGAVDND